MSEYHGEERRNDLEIRLIMQEIRNLNSLLEKSEESSLEWRTAFCKKIDALQDKLAVMPCAVHAEQVRNLSKHIGAMQSLAFWGFGIILTGMFALGVGWGDQQRIVKVNTTKWANLEPAFIDVKQDVEVLKETHRGVFLKGDTHESGRA